MPTPVPATATSPRHLGLILTLLTTALAVARGSPGTFKVAIVGSMTGGLTDWNDTLSGYELWLSQASESSFNIVDRTGSSFPFAFQSSWVDDESDESKHVEEVKRQINDIGAHFIMNANPSFATKESVTASNLRRVNMHAVTGNGDVFASKLPGVFSVSQDNAANIVDIFQEFRSKRISGIIIAYRSSNKELASACIQAELTAKAELLKYTTVPYTDSEADEMSAVANILGASEAEVLVLCGLSSETSKLSRLLDNMKRPLKAFYATNGPVLQDWNTGLGSLSSFMLTSASWHPAQKSGSDTFYGSIQDYTSKFSARYGREPSYMAASASAAGLVLMTSLQSAFIACDISGSNGDAQQLLYGSGTITCSDNLNDGYERLLRSILLLSMDTVFGTVSFNQQGMNFALTVKTLQVYPQTKDLKQVFTPFIALPLAQANNKLTVPNPNRYAPICQPGTYKNPDEFKACIPCAAGHYSSQPNSVTCNPCPKSTYANTTGNSECDECPTHTETLSRGSINLDQCLCAVNYYNKPGRGGYPCEDCPAQSVCDGGTSWPRPLPGWYGEVDTPFQFYNCNPNFQCEGDNVCKAGYSGRMCNYCDRSEGNEHFWAVGRCFKCPGGAVVIFALVLMIVGYVILNVSVTRGLEFFNVLMNFCQLVSIVNNFNTNWPDLPNVVMNFAGVLSFEVDMVQPQCLMPEWDFLHNLIAQLTMPIFMASITLLWIAYTFFLFRAKMMVMGNTPEDPSLGGIRSGSGSYFIRPSITMVGGGGSSTTSLGEVPVGESSSGGSAAKLSTLHLFMAKLFHVPDDWHEMWEVIYDRLSIPLMFLNIAYLGIFKFCLSAFFCFDFYGVKYVYYMPHEQCYSPRHWMAMMVASGGLVFWVLGTWIMFLISLRHMRKRRSFGEKRNLLLFGWIYDRYKAECYWFELMVLSQKTIFVAVMVFMLEYPQMQLMITFFVAVAAVVLNVHMQAYVDTVSQVLNTLSDALVLLVIVIGLIFINDLDPTVYDILGKLTAGIVISFIGAMTLLMLWELFLYSYISTLMSKHARMVKKRGFKVRRLKYMYHVFSPVFMMRWLSKANADDWKNWHTLCILLSEYVHPTSEVSYLSQKKVGRFWRFLLLSFPEVLDYFLATEDENRNHLVQFIEVMYEFFFDSKDEELHQLNHVVNDKYRAPLTQWMTSATDAEISFFQNVMSSAFRSARGEEAAESIGRAMSRSKSQYGTKTNTFATVDANSPSVAWGGVDSSMAARTEGSGEMALNEVEDGGSTLFLSTIKEGPGAEDTHVQVFETGTAVRTSVRNSRSDTARQYNAKINDSIRRRATATLSHSDSHRAMNWVPGKIDEGNHMDPVEEFEDEDHKHRN